MEKILKIYNISNLMKHTIKNNVVVAYNKNRDISKAASVFLNLAKMRFKEHI